MRAANFFPLFALRTVQHACFHSKAFSHGITHASSTPPSNAYTQRAHTVYGTILAIRMNSMRCVHQLVRLLFNNNAQFVHAMWKHVSDQ